MIAKLLMFTGITFILFLLGGIWWYYSHMGGFFYYFIIGLILFAGSNFAFYYAVLVKGIKKIDGELKELLEQDRIDLKKEINTPLLPFLGKFIKRFNNLLASIFKKLLTSAGKASVFNAKFNFELQRTIKEVNENMQSFDEINTTMQDAARAVSDITQNIEEFNNFMDTVDNTAKNALEVISSVGESIKNNVEMMRHSKELIDQLNSNLSNITNIVGVINDIADQTNLLALNAAIEAARAGEAGRGFAVVADEVRKLAEKTQQNASEIKEMIDTVSENASKLIEQNLKIAERIENSGEKSKELIDSFQNVVENIDQAKDMLNNIMAAVEQQSASIEEVTKTVTEVVESTRETVERLNKVSKESVDLSEIADITFSVIKKIKIDHEFEHIFELIKQAKKEIEETIEDAIKKGIISSSDIWDRNYVPVPNTNPQKYKTRFTDFFKKYIQPIEDKYLAMNPKFKFFIAVDNNGYAPAHNSIYDKPLTGDYEKDLVGNRSMRIFNDPTGIKAARNTESILIQTYMRDTGNAMYDISAPLFVEGKHWGAVRVGMMP